MLFLDRIIEAQCDKGYYITYSRGKRGQAPFAHTIGLASYDMPELFISGLGRTLSRNLLCQMTEFMLSGYEIAPGIAYDQFFEDMKCAFGVVHKAFYPYYFGKAIRHYYHHTDFKVLQCVWPNAVFSPGEISVTKQDILISEMPKVNSELVVHDPDLNPGPSS